MDYEKELSDVPFYTIHPEYKPFVGEKYDMYRILLVGESHYIGQTSDNEHYSLSYFQDNWWNGSCEELHQDYRAGYYTTRTVVSNYKDGKRTRAHGIFTNTVKSFGKVVLGKEIVHINTEESRKIEYFAFMNYFQMPSLYSGMRFWESLKRAAGADKDRAYEVWEKAVYESSKVLDKVIDVLSPQLVIFASKSAGCAYKKSNVRHSNDDTVVIVSHPGCSYWNKRLCAGTCGREEFENYLREFILK